MVMSPDEDGVFVATEFLIFFVSNMIQSIAVFSGSWTCVYLFYYIATPTN